jgi:hypothetical protein
MLRSCARLGEFRTKGNSQRVKAGLLGPAALTLLYETPFSSGDVRGLFIFGGFTDP